LSRCDVYGNIDFADTAWLVRRVPKGIVVMVSPRDDATACLFGH
jgi:hypothetical protein